MITLITYGEIKQLELKKLCEIYTKRINTLPTIRFKVLPYKETADFEDKIKTLAAKEGHKLFLLTEIGNQLDTHQFHNLIKTNYTENENFTFVIGPSEGFSDELKKELPSISLSKLTFPHEVAQLLFIEQIYRTTMLELGRDYHK